MRRRKTAEKQLDRLDGRLDERPEQTTEVKGIVHRNPVEEDEILVRFASANVVAGGEVAAGEHSGKELERPQEIGLADRRHAVGDPPPEGDHPGTAPGVEAVAGITGRHRSHGVERKGERDESDQHIGDPPGGDHCVAVRDHVAEGADAKRNGSGGEPGDDVSAGVVGDRRAGGATHRDLRSGDRFAGRSGDDDAGDGSGRIPLLRRGAGQRAGEQRDPRHESPELTHASSPGRATDLLPRRAD